MRRHLGHVAALLSIGLPALAALPVRPAQTGVSAAEGWVRLSTTGDAGAAAFVVVENPTMYDVYLVSATSDVAGTVEFRDARGADVTPPPTVKEVTVPAYGRLDMAPDGVHLWLASLTRPLAAGDMLTITLTTDSGVPLSVPVVVKDR